MAPESFRCADSSQDRDEPLYGTASTVRRWLLLEQPGSWGPDALMESRLPERTAIELRRRARAVGARIVLVRRGVRLAGPKRQCYFAVTDVGHSRLSGVELDDVDDLMDLDLSPLAEGQPIEGAEPRLDPLFLVCTHGRHDACCSIRGNQVSRVACAEPDLNAWECSHIGGDRFAANVVAFPEGIYYGRVRADDVVGLISAYAEGSLSLPHYRGRCCYSFALQAAEYFARVETAMMGIRDVSLLRSSPTVDGVWATFSIAGGNVVEVRIRTGEAPERHLLTCGSSEAAAIPSYDLISCEIRRPTADDPPVARPAT